MAIRIGLTLPDRAVPDDWRLALFALNRQIVPVIKELLRKLTQAPSSISWNAGDATLDVGKNCDFALDTLTSDSEIVLSSGFDGAQGYIFVKQDVTGGWQLDFSTDDSRTVLYEDPATDGDPNPDPSSITRYRYHFVTVDAARCVVIERMYLL